RRDAPDSFEFPKLLFDFFLSQVDKYAGASDSTLQQLRYLREGVFLKYWTPEAAAQDALRRRGDLRSGPAEDLAAFQGFAEDMRSKPRPSGEQVSAPMSAAKVGERTWAPADWFGAVTPRRGRDLKSN